MKQYPESQRKHHSSFGKQELYRSVSVIVELVVTSQGAESQMSDILRKHIQFVEPQKMLGRAIMIQRSHFLKRQADEINHYVPVPPHDKHHFGGLMRRAQVHSSCVLFDQKEDSARYTLIVITF